MSLGSLAALQGQWQGTGFNAIWRPQAGVPGQDRFLELNMTNETLSFSPIPGTIVNRGLFDQPDVSFSGLSYLQQVSSVTGEGLHFEPGLWINVPASREPKVVDTVCRMASIPHGTTINAQGVAVSDTAPYGGVLKLSFVNSNLLAFPTAGGPAINFPELDLSKPTQFRRADPGVTQELVNNPNAFLTHAIQGLTIHKMVTLEIDTLAPSAQFPIQPPPHTIVPPAAPSFGGGAANIAFLQGTPANAPAGANQANANAARMNATFWVIQAQQGNGPLFSMLLYSQTVLLNFATLSWPHVSVAALRQTDPHFALGKF